MTALALCPQPDLVVFDEPTTALDVTTQIDVLSAIKDAIRDTGVAALYITHDLAVVAQVSDHIMVLQMGEKVEYGTTDQIINDPQEDYTKALVSVRSIAHEEKKPTDEPVLSVTGITARYRGTPFDVLHNVTVDLHPGQTLAIVGESGSGKSTMARVVMGLLPPSGGSLHHNGAALPKSGKQRPRDLQRHIQMIHQMADTALNPKHRIKDIIGRPLEFFLGLKGRAKDVRIRELLTLIELDPDEFINRMPSELSGGQKQRVCIARALAAEPDFIICDEVTSALDQLVAEGILRLLDRLQREMDLTYMFITHDIATVRSIADEVVVMQNGVIVEQGPKETIFSPPHAPYTELLLSSVPEMDPDWLTGLLKERGAVVTSEEPL